MCAGYLRTLLRLILTDIGQMAQTEKEIFTEFQTNFGISFESEISKTADSLTKLLEEDAEPKSYLQILRAFILTALHKLETVKENRLDDPITIFQEFEYNYNFMFTETLIVLNSKMAQMNLIKPLSIQIANVHQAPFRRVQTLAYDVLKKTVEHLLIQLNSKIDFGK